MDAKNSLIELLDLAIKGEHHKELAVEKKNQVGSGMRGDKKRTYRFQDDQVLDHDTNKRAKCSKVMKGGIDLLW